MEYTFKDLLPREEVTARQGYYKDWTHIDANTFHQISELAQFIREKGHGVDTREAIAQALERVYHDAAQSGNANMEVSMARKHFENLASRLDASDQAILNVLNEASRKIDNASGTVTMDNLSQAVKEAMTGGSVAVVGNDMVGNENLRYKAVTHDKTDFLETGTNLFDKSRVNMGYVVHAGTGELTQSSGGSSSSGYVPVIGNQTYYKNGTAALVYFDSEYNRISGTSTSENVFETPSNARFIITNIPDTDIDTFQINKGDTRLPYEEFYVKIKNAKSTETTGNLLTDIKFNRETRTLVFPDLTRVGTADENYVTSGTQVINIDTVNTFIKSLYFNANAKRFELEPISNDNENIYIFSSDFTKSPVDIDHVIEYSTGRNLLSNDFKAIGKVINSTGELITSPSGANSFYMVPIKPNTTYAFNEASAKAFYDKTGALVSYDGTAWGNSAYKKVVTTGENVAFVSLNMASTTANSQVEENGQFSGYVAYSEVTNKNDEALTIKIPLEANTSKVDRTHLLSKDIANYYPFNEVKVCNVKKTSWGATDITYEGESGFARDASNGDVMVEIPKVYFKRWKDSENEYVSVSGQALDGYQLEPAFIENGKELDKIYVAAYEGTVYDNLLYSRNDAIPATKYTLTQFREYARSRGQGYGLFDFRTLAMLQRLFMVYYADRNSEVVGMGMALYTYQSNNHAKAVTSATNTNQIRVGVPNNINRQKVGQNVQVVDNMWDIDVPTRKITAIEEHENGERTITFNGNPYNVIAGTTIIASRPNDTGYTDSVSGLNGESNSFGGETGFEAVKFMGIENLWGNCWNEIDGVALDNLVAYVGMNMDDYSSSLADVKSKYVPLNKKLPLQTDNHQSSTGDNNQEYIRNLLLDPTNPAYSVPFELGGGRSSHYADPYYSYADVSNMNAGEYLIPAHGGGIDHNYRAGLFTMRFWYTPDQTWDSMHNSRLIYKPL